MTSLNLIYRDLVILIVDLLTSGIVSRVTVVRDNLDRGGQTNNSIMRPVTRRAAQKDVCI